MKKTLSMPLFVLALLAAPAAARAQAMDKQVLADHIRESYDVPGEVSITIGDFRPSEIPAFQDADVTFGAGEHAQTQVLHISTDGRHYLLGDFKDISVHPDQERLKKINQTGAPVRGNSNAKVTVIEYTDFECPYCQRGYQIMVQRVMKEYRGKVRWIYKSLPLKAIHPWAEPAAVAAECAHLQGQDKFWKLHDALFEQQRDIRPGTFEAQVKELAAKAGVDSARFALCLRDQVPLPAVRRDLGEAEALGLNGTPAFLVNGHLVSGADYDGLKRSIDRSLEGKRGGP